MKDEEALSHIKHLLEIYDQGYITGLLKENGRDPWTRETINRWVRGKANAKLSIAEYKFLEGLLPRPFLQVGHKFRFVDLFAGIGGIRRGFDEIGGKCVFTSEWDRFVVRTYKANHYKDSEEQV